MIKIKKGLDLPIGGAPNMHVEDGPQVSRVALVGSDYQGMKPTLLVAEGDRVVLGQPVFNDKKNPEVVYCAPATGKVIAINRGEPVGCALIDGCPQHLGLNQLLDHVQCGVSVLL